MLRFRHRFNQHFSTDPSFYEFIAIYLYGTEVVFSEKRRYDVTSFGIVGKHPSSQGCHFGDFEAKFEKFGLLANHLASRILFGLQI